MDVVIIETPDDRKSTSVASFGYDEVAKQLYIEFRSRNDAPNARYVYHKVPPEIAVALYTEANRAARGVDDASVGGYVTAVVKKGLFAYDRLADDDIVPVVLRSC